MGIAGFYLWLKRWYATCIENIPMDVVSDAMRGIGHPEDGAKGPGFDNLYLDMNGLVHPCCHDTAPLPEPASEEEMFERIFAQVDLVFKIVRPRKCLVMCVDGVAPQSKMNQQRSRRFRAAEESVESGRLSAECLAELRKKGLPEPDIRPRWDHNVITPATPFMERLGLAVEWFILKKLNEDPAWGKIVVVFSDAHVAGEGEHKIMQYIRGLRVQPGYDPNTSHVIYGMDADLICLGLITHERNVTILRNQLTDSFQAAHNAFCYFHIAEYRECLRKSFLALSGMNLERIIDDFVFLCFFVGNDFLPHIPLISLKAKGLEMLLNHYVEELCNTSYLTNKGEVNFAVLPGFLERFVANYMNQLKREYAIMWGMRSRAKCRVKESLEQCNAGVKAALGDLKPDRSNAQKISNVVYGLLLSAAKERARFVGGKEPLGFSYSDENFRDKYYETKFGWDPSNRRKFEKKIARCCAEYYRGTQWVMRYYTVGCPSWEWFYPYYYAPLLEDLAAFSGTVNVEMHLGVPRHPVVQLLAVLPRLSVKGLPEPLHNAVLDPDSVLGEFYPDTIDVDHSEANFSYQGVLKLPFIDSEKLQAACQTLVELVPDRGVVIVMCHKMSELSLYLEEFLGERAKKNPVKPLPPGIASRIPIAGGVGHYKWEWPRDEPVECPMDGISGECSFVSPIECNAARCYRYVASPHAEYRPVLLSKSDIDGIPVASPSTVADAIVTGDNRAALSYNNKVCNKAENRMSACGNRSHGSRSKRMREEERTCRPVSTGRTISSDPTHSRTP
uniref:Putative 5'-3' exoribonuclease 2 n=1 Tax=Trypanosoma congolense (strain IL3000) TaxID=1068625 RepID=G0UWJ7_TRYCI|nr:putative 5'-3' exoribonuclease 2 [Trypanosoma congolense IL3000]